LNTKKSGHGLQAITWWKNGEIEKVKSYCLDDVKITKEIYEYALANKKIKFTEGGTVIEVPLKTDGWETKKDSGVTFTLPF
jgi:DEAD/DEAH box helicase domain-containing protein